MVLKQRTDLIDLLPHAGGHTDQVVVAQTLEQGQPPHKLEGARSRCMPHHKLHAIISVTDGEKGQVHHSDTSFMQQ